MGIDMGINRYINLDINNGHGHRHEHGQDWIVVNCVQLQGY